MAFTWTRTSDGIVNAEGNLIVLTVTLSNTTNFSRPNVDANTTEGRPDYVGPIRRWRCDDAGHVFVQDETDPEEPDGGVVTGQVFPFDMGEVEGPTGGIYSVTFRVGIELKPTERIAVHPRSLGTLIHKILRLGNQGPGLCWLTLDTGGDAPEWDDIPLDVSAIGRLPDVSGASLLNVDSQAQWVKGNGATADPLLSWYDLSAAENNLSGSGNPTLSDAGSGRIAVGFGLDASSSNDRFALSSPPVITTRGTFAALLIPDASTSSTSHIVGRYHPGQRSWRLYYDPSQKEVVYQTRYSSSNTDLSLTTGVDTGANPIVYDTTILVLVRRDVIEGVGIWTAWMNGRTLHDASSIATAVNDGVNDLTIGARVTTAPSTWGEAFKGEINQVAVYDEYLNDIQVSLVLHQMADRAAIDLGTPIKGEWRVQPYDPASNPSVPANRRLDRKPIAVVTLNSGNFRTNTFGQTDSWRINTGNPSADKAAIKDALRPLIARALGESDQFEVMFNRPGGKYREDIVPSYVFGSAPSDYYPSSSEAMILPQQWDAMKELWTEFNLSDHNDPANRTAENRKMRRGWFYTGGGLGVNDADGSLNTNGFMFNRVVAPATPAVYKTQILDHWVDTGGVGDDRFRCFFMDAAVNFFGKQVELVHDEDIYENFTLVGEAIPQGDMNDFPDQGASRLGAPWFGVADLPKGPWWNKDPGKDFTSIKRGYNINWESNWADRPIYFGVLGGDYLNLHLVFPTNDLTGNNLTLGNIYNWVVKGATPVAWSTSTLRKVGAAFDYGTGRVIPSRSTRNPRSIRGLRV